MNLATIIHLKQPFVSHLQNSVHKNFEKFTGKDQCRSLVFNKVAGWRHKSCRLETQNQHQLVDSLVFFIAPPVTKSKLSPPFTMCALTNKWKIRELFAFYQCHILCPMFRLHYVKSVQIRSFFRSVFSLIRTEYKKIRTRKNSVFGHFSRSVMVCGKDFL